MTGDYSGSAPGIFPPSVPSAPPLGPKRKSRFVTIVLAIGALAVVGGIVAALVLFGIPDGSGDVEVRIPKSPAAQQQATTSSQQTAQATPPTAVRNDEVFTFRDIFEPLLKEIEPTSSTDGGSPNTTTPVDTSEYSPNTLYLIDIVTSGATPQAVLVWDQDEMTLEEGDVISGTPWQVLEIRTTSVIMLYGDQQVVLTVGQGIQK